MQVKIVRKRIHWGVGGGWGEMLEKIVQYFGVSMVERSELRCWVEAFLGAPQKGASETERDAQELFPPLEAGQKHM